MKKSTDSISSILNTDEKQARSLIKKSKLIKKEQNTKLNAECYALRENEANSFSNEACDLFDDDLSVKEENEVI